MAITVFDLAIHRGVKESPEGSVNGSEFERVGLPMIGGCEICAATIAAYNSYPSKSGFLRCYSCIMDSGWEDVAQANADIFPGEKT